MAETKRREAASGATPHCLHVVGIGRSGAGYVDGLLRTGEVEDLLMNSQARVAALVVDVGEEDLYRVQGYADALHQRMAERGVPAEHFHFQSVSLEVPSVAALIAGSKSIPDGKSWLKNDVRLPATGSHLSRAVAKAIYAGAYYAEERPLDAALGAFAEHVGQTELPSRVMVCFNLAGGTGSGMAIDLARHLTHEKLGGRIPVIGVGQLPHSGDGAVPASLFTSLNEFACVSDKQKNAELAKGQGDNQDNPFTGGFIVVNTEHSWQRLTSYTKTGEKGVRSRIRQEVTNKFAQDSFMRFAMRDSGAALSQVLNAAGEPGSPNSWILFNLAKFTHPGVQVLPGEPLSKWRKVIDQWIDHLDDYSGLREDFRANRADIHLHAPREVGFDHIEAKLRTKIAERYVSGSDAPIEIARHEFFDYLTSYADIALPGVSRTDLECLWKARDAYEKLGADEQKLCHAWLLEKGVAVSSTKAAAV